MKAFLIAGALLSLLLLAGCAGSGWTDVKDGAALELEIGETKMVALDTNGGVPYLWEPEGFDPDVVLVGDADYKSVSKQSTVGGPLKAVFGIRGLAAGETVITFAYRHVGDKTVDETRSVSVFVK